MSNYNELKLKNGTILTSDLWNGLLDQLADTELKIPDNENGEILNGVTVGTKPGNGKELNYPWAYETIGTSKKNHNLRLQSPNGVYVHTGVGKDENANKTKIALAITKDSRVGISNIPVGYPLDVVADTMGGMLLSSKDNTLATELKLFTQRKNMGQHFWSGTVGSGNKGWMLQAIHSNHKTADQRDSFRIYFHDDKKWNQALCISAKTRNVGLGTNTPVAKLQIINAEQDAQGNTLILGPTNKSNLRLGYHKNYSWIQSHGSKPLYINPLGNNVYLKGFVGVGTATPKSPLHIKGNAGILNIEGTDHGYLQFYPLGYAKKRQAWLGFGSKSSKDFSIKNDRTGGRIMLYGQTVVVPSAGERGYIVMHSHANKDGAKKILKGLKPHQLVIGGAWDNHLYFFWKNKAGKNRMAEIGSKGF